MAKSPNKSSVPAEPRDVLISARERRLSLLLVFQLTSQSNYEHTESTSSAVALTDTMWRIGSKRSVIC